MQITCEQCSSTFKVADEKIPEGKRISVRCPKCQSKNSIQRPAPAAAPEKESAPAAAGAFGFEERPDEGTYDASEKPFDFIEEEGETALICETDAGLKQKLSEVLKLMEYHLSEAEDTRDALKKMRYHQYDMIVINETFSSRSPDANGVLIFLERLDMKTRREIFVVLLSKRFKTMDHMAAFKKSVNLVININDVKHFDKILNRGLTDYHQFYRIFKETAHNVGVG